MKCPLCGSGRLAPIAYGLPDFNEETVRRMENEEVYFGGCLILPGYPRYHCYACGGNVITTPRLRTKKGLEDCLAVTAGIRFALGTEAGGPCLRIDRREDGIRLEVSPEAAAGRQVFQREMPETEWEALLDRIYNGLHVHEWHRLFIVRGPGAYEKWDMEIRYTENRTVRYLGLGGRPPYWEELTALLRPFFREAGTDI